MSKKLTIVVTCTNRKSVPPLPDRQVRNLPHASVETRVAAWNDIMVRTSDTRPLRQLYCGEAWHQVGRLEAAARAKSLEPDIYVVSAGLGLRKVDSAAPSYAATFTRGHADSVGVDRIESRTWWSQISRSSSAACFDEALAGPTLLVLSEVYASAMLSDLKRLEPRDDVVLFGGTPRLLENQRFDSNLKLRRHLGGTAGSLNGRMAIAWLEQQERVDMRASATRRHWETWAHEVGVITTYDRRIIDDASLQTWIQSARRARPELSKTAALRMLRDSGVACEQRRFGELFAQAVEDA